MSSIPSPILIFGDSYISKNNLVSVKKKYSNLKWVTKSASKDSLNDIRMEASISSWDDSEKVMLIQELPNKKNVREFLLDLAQTCHSQTKLIIWDSSNQITVDPKSQTIEKTWSDFVSDIRKIPGSKVINNGEKLTEKSGEDGVNFVIKKFEDCGKVIESKEAKLLLSIVGYDRGMLESDIKKMSIIAPDYITAQFILDNAFSTTRESLLYKINNMIDSGNYEGCIDIIERFLSSGTNHNEIAVVIAKKARWQLAATYFWYSGIDWSDIPNKLMEMGRFPSDIWHDFQIDSREKKFKSEKFQGPNGIVKYMSENMGIPRRILKLKVEEEVKEAKPGKENKVKTTRKGAEVLPFDFLANLTVDFVKNKIVNANREIPINILKEKILDRAIRVYLFVQNKLSEIRYNGNPDQDLQEMVTCIVNTRII